MTRSDHEIMTFNLLSKNVQKIDSLLNASYNVPKSKLNQFYQKSAIESRICKIKNASVNLNFNCEKYEKMTILLRSTIKDAIVENISKRRSCNQSKV